MEKLKSLLKDLTSLSGNVGYEDDVIAYVCQYLSKYKEHIQIDSLGNISIHVSGNQHQNKQKVMIFAHMDEVGMMVKQIREDGFLRIEKLGSINPNVVHGQRVKILGEHGDIAGVIGVKSHHLLQAKDKYHTQEMAHLYVDIGCHSREEVLEKGIIVGSPIVMSSNFLDMGMYVSNKAMDDRALIAVLLQICEQIEVEKLDCDLYIVCSVQEEFNTRGILPTVKKIQPDIVIGLDVTPACDTPELKGTSSLALGKGCAFTYMNHHSRGTLAGLVPNKRFLNDLEEIARKHSIEVQHEVCVGILTETAYIIFEKSDLVVANISIPTRYTHTPIETIHMLDLCGLYELLTAFLYEFKSTMQYGKQFDGLDTFR